MGGATQRTFTRCVLSDETTDIPYASHLFDVFDGSVRQHYGVLTSRPPTLVAGGVSVSLSMRALSLLWNGEGGKSTKTDTVLPSLRCAATAI